MVLFSWRIAFAISYRLVISLSNRLNDLLGFRGVQRDARIKLTLGGARHVSIQVTSAFTAKLEFASGGHFEAAFARFVGLHLRHKSSAKF